jgi:exosortase
VEKDFHLFEAWTFLLSRSSRTFHESNGLGDSAQGLLLRLAGIDMSPAPVDQKVAPAEFPTADFGAWFQAPSTQLVLGAGLVGALVALNYYRVIGKLVIDWWQIPDDSHGFLVPLFAGYLVWLRREKIRQLRITPAWTGVPVILFGLALLLLGDFGAELFLSRISIVILLTGLTICFGGWALLHELRFPLLVLLIAIPIPAILLNHLTLPMQILASKAASDVLPLFGVPVLRDGNVIQLPAIKLEVAEACSGIRSLVSLVAISILYGYFAEKSNLRRALLVMFSAPIAIAANSLRIVGTGLCVQYWDAEKAMGFFHEFSGWVMFLVSVACLFLTHRAMSVLWKVRPRP